MWPSQSIHTTTGSCGSESFAASVFGRSTGTPTVSSGAVTMKMTSSTSMTSTNGVTLISLIGRPPRLPRGRSPGTRIGAAMSGRLLELARQDRAELAREGVEARGVLVDVARSLFVGEHRRDGGDEAERTAVVWGKSVAVRVDIGGCGY